MEQFWRLYCWEVCVFRLKSTRAKIGDFSRAPDPFNVVQK